MIHDDKEASAVTSPPLPTCPGVDSADSKIAVANDDDTSGDGGCRDPDDTNTALLAIAVGGNDTGHYPRRPSDSDREAALTFSQPHMYDASTHLHHALTEEHWREYMEPWSMTHELPRYIPDAHVGKAFAFDADRRGAEPKLSMTLVWFFERKGRHVSVGMYLEQTSSLEQVCYDIHDFLSSLRTEKAIAFRGLKIRHFPKSCREMYFEIIGER